MQGRLTQEQIEFFKTEGYVLFRQPVFPPDKFAALKAHFEKSLAAWNQVGGRTPEAMDVPHFTDPKIFDWIFADEVLDMIEPLIGPDIALWASHFLCKPPKAGKRVPWHEDSAYFGSIFQPMELVTFWLAIDPSTPENGCMRIIPRTHHNGFSKYHDVTDTVHNTFKSELNADQFDELKAVDMILEPNQCSIHHVKLIHGSNPNKGTMRRCGFNMRFMPTTTRFTIDGRHKGWQLYLGRGRDRAGNVYSDRNRINEAWLDAYPEERQRYDKLHALQGAS